MRLQDGQSMVNGMARLYDIQELAVGYLTLSVNSQWAAALKTVPIIMTP